MEDFDPSDEALFLIDVNDPRNFKVLDKYRKSRSQHIRKLLEKDKNFALSDITSLRQELIIIKNANPTLKFKVPLREEEIAKNPEMLEHILERYKRNSINTLQYKEQRNDIVLIQNVTKVESFPQNPDTKNRIITIKNILKERQLQVEEKGQKDTTKSALERVINEWKRGPSILNALELADSFAP